MAAVIAAAAIMTPITIALRRGATVLGTAPGAASLPAGVARGARTAGADSVISSLWSVGDESTRELMQSFYTNLLERGMGTLAALRSAQLDMLRENNIRYGGNARPATWGAFVVDGDWR